MTTTTGVRALSGAAFATLLLIALCALVLAWPILGQTIAPAQVGGALIVVGAVMALGMSRR
jgi:drug/metabolite transporter (DMT)-like permease